MTTVKDFMPAILADPASDAPRLVLADFLDEHDDPLGEFIRVQCRIAAVEAEVESGEDCDNPGCPTCSELRPLRQRERELLDARGVPVTRTNLWRWLSPSPFPGPPCRDSEDDYGWVTTSGPPTENAVCRVTFRRGFIDTVVLPTQPFLDHAAALFAAQPATRVTLSDRWPVASEGLRSFTWGLRRRGRSHGLDLPPELFGLLLPDPACVRVRDHEPHGTSVRDYHTEADALAGLSWAAVRLGRARAELPPYPGGPTP